MLAFSVSFQFRYMCCWSAHTVLNSPKKTLGLCIVPSLGSLQSPDSMLWKSVNKTETWPLKALSETFVTILLVSWKNWFYLYQERLSEILTEASFHLTWSRAQSCYNFYPTFVNKWDFSRHLILVFNVCILQRQMFYKMADLFTSLLFNVTLFLLGGRQNTQQKRAEMRRCSGKWPNIPKARISL